MAAASSSLDHHNNHMKLSNILKKKEIYEYHVSKTKFHSPALTDLSFL